jgi:predicted dehydrogenase
MSKIEIGLVGAGPIAIEYTKILKKFNKQVNLSCVITRSKKNYLNIKKIFPKIKKVDRIEELYRKYKPKIVIVATNELVILNIYKKILKFNWVVLFEKPLGLNYFEAKKIISKIPNRIIKKTFIAYNRRNYESVLKLKKIVQNKKKPISLIVNDQQSPEGLKLLGYHKKIIKNLHYVNSIHLIDLILYICRGKIISLKRIFKNKNFVFCKIIFSSGDYVFYFSKWDISGRMSISMNLEKKNILVKPIEKINGKDYVKISNKKFKPGFYNQVNNLIYYFKKKKIRNLTTIDEGMKSVELVKRIYEI